MKKSFVISVAFVLLAAVSSFAVAGGYSDSATVEINGSVKPVLMVTVSNPVVDGVVLEDDGGTIDLGKVTFWSNFRAWTVTFESKNAGALLGGQIGDDRIKYTLEVAEVLKETSLAKEQTVNRGERTPRNGTTHAMLARYEGFGEKEMLTYGDYSDTITITVRAN